MAEMGISTDTVLIKSDDVVFRKIGDEYLLVPIVKSAADVEAMFNLNETGAAIWEKIDGVKSLGDIMEDIRTEYENEDGQIEKDVISFVSGMLEAKLIVAK